MIEMQILARVEFDGPTTVRLVQPPVLLDTLDIAQLAVSNFQFVGRRNKLDCGRSAKNSLSPRGRLRHPAVGAALNALLCHPAARLSTGFGTVNTPY